MREVLEDDDEVRRLIETDLVTVGETCPLFVQPLSRADKFDPAPDAVRGEFHVYEWLIERGHMTREGRPLNDEAAAVAAKARSIFGGMRAGVAPADRSDVEVALVPVGWDSVDLTFETWTPNH